MSEMLHFHSSVSGALVAVQNNLPAAGLDFLDGSQDIFAQIVSSGKVLSGLMRHPGTSQNEAFLEYAGSATSAFVSAMLANPVPTSAFNLISSFFDFRISDNDNESDAILQEPQVKISDVGTEISGISQKAFNLIHNCELALAHTERQLARTKILASQMQKNTAVTKCEKRMECIFPDSRTMNKVMQDALLEVMVERDKGHSELVATRVFHTHEMDQQRRKIEMLESKLKFMEDMSNRESAAAAAFFLGQETIPDVNSMTRIEEEMVQNVDQELTALCRQLSSEISSRVAAELEIVRLKESRRVERNGELSDRTSIQEQLEHYKQKTEEEAARCKVAIKEKEEWRQSFQRLLELEDIDPKEIR
eukprot:CAMPEP_0197245550 /NCGR_PEP_ID=MMETSP1429-20130617/10305_1 /TAXON_ID=49237 /ORGANISM="Chaetoceros  sp., Strain UNC1202" /LENGTH=362 /DNA_ID=CAMNT_0042706075 /DNA_START=168 /DNA_END=1256 /DNA_ORIENTATION=-